MKNILLAVFYFLLYTFIVVSVTAVIVQDKTLKGDRLHNKVVYDPERGTEMHEGDTLIFPCNMYGQEYKKPYQCTVWVTK